MASLSLYISVWVGIILVGLLTGQNMMVDAIFELFENPVVGVFDLLVSAFTDPKFLALVFGMSVVAGGFASIITGNNFSILYVLPMAIVFTLLQLFVLPTEIIMGPLYPVEIQIIYSLFIGGLTVLTLISFVGGRN